MVRYIPIGNGKVLISFNDDYELTDFYYSRDMAENHSGGKPFKYGISIDDHFNWINKSFIKSKDYYDHTMIGIAKYSVLGINFEDLNFVDIYKNIFVRHTTVINNSGNEKDIKIFYHQNFSIYGNNIGDTAFYHPEYHSIIHYKGRRYFMATTASPNGSFDQYAIGIKDYNGMAGTWMDAEDNNLEGNDVATGSVDSMIRHHLILKPHTSAELYYYIIAARDRENLFGIAKEIDYSQLEKMHNRTEHFWELWVSKYNIGIDKYSEIFKKSLFIIRAHLNDIGAILASSDSEILRSNMDSYYYAWPRDAAYTAIALILSGHSDPAKLFFEFCSNAVADEGYMYHKYNPDGKIASSWLPYVMNGKEILPIQEDESALVIIAIWYYHSVNNDIEYLSMLYKNIITKIADFLVNYIDEAGLPKASFDLWEERYGVHTYTIATVYKALKYASYFASLFNDKNLSIEYSEAADKMLLKFDDIFYSDLVGYYGRTFNGSKTDFTLDSSIMALVNLGVKDPEDPRIKSSIQNIERILTVKNIGGIARYQNDLYQRRESNPEITGNPWIITTLWLADYYISNNELDKADKLISWVSGHSEASGILSEQIDPTSGKPISVSPLIWSHAQLIITLINYKNKLDQNNPIPK
ncbi:MAG: glycoside hydrolase family 15 protein [Ferroplasma sp.]